MDQPEPLVIKQYKIMSMLKKLMSVWIVLTLAVVDTWGQSLPNEKEAISMALSKALLLKNSDPSECVKSDITFSCITILFDRKGNVDRIVHTNLPACVDAEKFKQNLVQSLNKLPLNKKMYRNKGVLAFLMYAAMEKTIPSHEIKKDWLTMVSGMDKLEVGSRKLKWIIPINVDLFGPKQ